MKALLSIYRSFRDLSLLILPINWNTERYQYGFLVHPRDENDVLRKYPFFKIFPKAVIRFFTRWYWPVIVTKVKGLKSVESETPIDGYILSIPLITKQILSNRKLAVKRIRQAIILARRYGIKIVGLGALTASVTRGGSDLTDIADIWITTGHAYTGYNVTQNLFELEKILNVDPTKTTVAIVGAAGSIGSISSQILVRAGYNNILLVDVERKKDRVLQTKDSLVQLDPKAQIQISYNVQDIKAADFIIAATNTPEALITAEMLKPGAVVIDDAQPSDVAGDVLERPDVLAIEAGVVYTSNVTSNFDLGLKGKNDNFCCMAEVLVLAAHEWKENFVIERTTLEFVDKITEWAKPLKFRVADFQNRKEIIPSEKIEFIKKVRESDVESK